LTESEMKYWEERRRRSFA